MTIRYVRRSGGLQGGGWRDKLQEIRALRSELTEYADLMSPYERNVIERDIKAVVDENRNFIVSGVIQDQDGAIARYKADNNKLRRANTKEISRWDPGKLLDEINLHKELVKQAISGGADGDILRGGKTSASRLEDLYQEARDSEDIYKQRAAAEVFQHITDTMPVGDPARTIANRVAAQAEKDLDAIRDTDELQKAETEKQNSWAKVKQATENIADVSKVLGEDVTKPFMSGDLSRAYNRIDTVNGRIFELDDPEVTNVYEVNKKEAHIAGG